jgi:hypothetical protein
MTSVMRVVLVMILLALGATGGSAQTPSGAAAGLPAYIPIPPDLDITAPAADVPMEGGCGRGGPYWLWA